MWLEELDMEQQIHQHVMANSSDLISATLRTFVGDLPSFIQEDKESIQGLLGTQVKAFQWKTEGKIALGFPIELEGSIFKNSGINKVEPFLLVYEVDQPNKAPRVYPNRADFPVEKHAHVNPKFDGDPTNSICLTLGDFDEWYSLRIVRDILVLIKEWLSKAAKIELSQDSEEYEALIMPPNSAGIIGYSSEKIALEVKSLINSKTTFISIVCLKQIHNHSTSIYRFDNDWKSHPTKTSLTKSHKFGMIVIPSSLEPTYTFRNSFPTTKKELINYFRKHRIDLEEILKSFYPSFINEPNNAPILDEVIILLPIIRPKPIRGTSENVEILHFCLRTGLKHPYYCPNSSPVIMINHCELPNFQTSKRLSANESEIPHIDLIGAGSLGSKFALFQGKKGNTDLSIYDHNYLKFHNFSRHPLSPYYIGKNKAESLVDTIRSLYPDSKLEGLRAFPNQFDLSKYIETIKDKKRILLDTTASFRLSQELTLGKIPPNVRLVQSFISDKGKIGFMLGEGQGRNCRIDDIEIMIKAYAKSESIIEDWLYGDNEKTTATIGFGCASETVIASDENISTHSSLFSQFITKEYHNESTSGYFYFSQIGNSQSISRKVEVEQFHSILSPQGKWELRVPESIMQKFKHLLKENLPNETGGILMGSFNKKTKVVHIVDISDSPADSSKTPTSFKRGTDGIRDYIRSWSRPTNRHIGYIGEWHTHPGNYPKLSGIDLKNIIDFKVINDDYGMPTLSLIVTNNGDNIVPHIFDINEKAK